MSITEHPFGTALDGTLIMRYVLTNSQGMEAAVMTYGGILQSLRTPDRGGHMADVTLGFDSLSPYLGDHPYFGALIGRFGNRIASGRFTLDGKAYQLACNNGPNHLHGGLRGFDKVVWRAEPGATDGPPALQLTYRSAEGEEGYPGALDVRVVYSLTEENELRLDYVAESGRPTIVNLTNHTYFNLGSADTVLGHEIQLDGHEFLPIDATFIPTGERRTVEGTPMDFRAPTTLGGRIHAEDAQIKHAGGGFDHTWVLAGGDGVRHAARVSEPESGRVMDVYTTQPGVQFYTGNMLDGTIRGKADRVYPKHGACCLDTQHFPDSPNHPRFPSTVLLPGAIYRHTTIYAFSAR
ncbi:MAG TPA: aldose epimerase family protein [Chloroflexia bacterium]|nr:aldose epimerase family protein [Chloroflexia bacterium]